LTLRCHPTSTLFPYTTLFRSYDRAYAKISNAKQIADAPEGVTHIIKYHGDFDEDSSLVLTETDFLNRLSFDSPLDIQFRPDALGDRKSTRLNSSHDQISYAVF